MNPTTTTEANVVEIRKRAQLLLVTEESPKSTLERDIQSAANKVEPLKKRIADLQEQQRYLSPSGGIRQFFLDLLGERRSIDFHRF
jgi:hypothetical protein